MEKSILNLLLIVTLFSCSNSFDTENEHVPSIQQEKIIISSDTTIDAGQFNYVYIDVLENVTLTFGTVMISSSTVRLREGASISVLGSANFHQVDLITDGQNSLCTPTGGSITVDGIPIDMPSDGSCKDLDTDLPVEMLYFNTILIDNKVQLEWATASEVNNEKFIIERSIDNKTWESIGEVEGAGNSNVKLEYSFLDDDLPNATIIYYRIQQVDFDGKITLYGPNAVSISNTDQEILVYPNPIKEGESLNVLSDKNGIEVDIFNSIGQYLGTSFTEMNYLEIEMNFGAGMFILEINSDGNSTTEKIIVN